MRRWPLSEMRTCEFETILGCDRKRDWDKIWMRPGCSLPGGRVVGQEHGCSARVQAHMGEAEGAHDEAQAVRRLEREQKLAAPEPEHAKLLDGGERAVC